MGYWPSLRSRWLDIGHILFGCACGLRWTQAIGPYKQTKKEPISSHLAQTSFVNKRFIIWEKNTISCRTQRVIPNRQDSSILPTRLPQSQYRTQFILSALKASHIIYRHLKTWWNIFIQATTLFLSSLDVEGVHSKGTWCEPTTAFLWQEHSHRGNVCHQHTDHQWNKWIW